MHSYTFMEKLNVCGRRKAQHGGWDVLDSDMHCKVADSNTFGRELSTILCLPS